ncbi:MAG TPA: hypothetical protein VIV60_29155 [Polyangiaceae bacterium]
MDLGSILSGPLGAIFGAGSAIVQKVIDYKDHNAQREQELALRDKDLEHLKVELANKSEIAKVDADMQIGLKEFDAVSTSIAADKASYGVTWVDAVRGMVRPVLTAAAMALVVDMTIIALRGEPLTQANRMEIVNEALFLAGTAIAWWFGARSNLGRKRV